MITAAEFWRNGTINGVRVRQILHRTEQGIWVEVNGEKWVVPYTDDGVPAKAELRLLPYLQTHLTLPEIGARLFISRNTVATEVGSIYRKLGVSSRAEAVERTMQMGLLGD